MSRLTITLEDTLYQALKEASIHQGISIGKIIEEALLLRDIKYASQAYELAIQVRQRVRPLSALIHIISSCPRRRASSILVIKNKNKYTGSTHM